MTEDVANLYVKGLDDNIIPYILNNTRPVLTVGYQCMEIRYTFHWTSGQNPFCIRPDRMTIHMVVENCKLYMVIGAEYCKPCKPAGSMSCVLCLSINLVG